MSSSKNPFDINISYKQEVGDFIMEFSNLEVHLGQLIHHFESGQNKTNIIPTIFADGFSKKRRRLRKVISTFPLLTVIWDTLDSEIGECNEFRNTLVHGLINKVLPNPNLEFLSTKKGEMKKVEISVDNIIEYRKKLVNISTGKDGLPDFTQLCMKELKKNK